jgi:hypothetical protein
MKGKEIMSNFKQFEHKRNARTPTKNRVSEAQQRWLDNHLNYLQMVENVSQLIKEIFVCHQCGKKITTPRWVLLKDPEYPDIHSKTRFYHSKSQCNPNFNRLCLFCGKLFRLKRKNQKLCSKKCSVSYMTSPILIKRCLTCGEEFKSRLIQNKKNNESYCQGCR